MDYNGPFAVNLLLEVLAKLLPEVLHKLIILRGGGKLRRLGKGELLLRKSTAGLIVGTCGSPVEGAVVWIRIFVAIIAAVMHCVTVDTTATTLSEASGE